MIKWQSGGAAFQARNNSRASTSGANADNVYFHGLSGTAANPIMRFALSQNDFVRYDDLGFIVAPPPAPTNLTAASGSKQITLSWSAVFGLRLLNTADPF